ncbi:hypothetical protein KC19_1G206700 [Ceratodon purpureus]|uniref:Uncharacterized protein n=1 Tax=Ceratodon purpureus TaxID=3225 RepID=A0A8T0J8L9_CERPU|nr:hypothetical protein KC19_1G206700 [Ceratodon purpureus]
MVAMDSDAEIRKPGNDSREYRAIVLPNELRVLLVSDPDTDKAAAAMSVNVGTFSNPEGLEGLAHFLEHMLFYSNKKYPEEGAYKLYLAEHGGRGNASTSAEYTNYHFEVNADNLEEALDRFAQFFICPLLSADATSREIKAVDAENSKNINLDFRRLRQVQKHISSKDHPYHKFGTGNLETLETRPKARGVDTLAELIKFYEAHYSSNLMCLVIYGKETLDNLQILAQHKFTDVKNSRKEPPRFLGQPCLQEHLQIVVKCVPVREHHILELLWPVRPSIENYKKGASAYLSHLLGHEADGSLFAYIKDLGWANSLEAGHINESFDFAFFRVHISLTEAGQEHMEEIVSLTFQYIRYLKLHGIIPWLYEEIRSLRATRFNFRDKTSPFDYATSLSTSMQKYPLEDWVAGATFLDDCDEEALSTALHQLRPDNVRIFWSSKQFQGMTTDSEPWYGTPYSKDYIDKEVVKEWETAAINPRLYFPSPNVFIASDFSIRDLDPEVKHPILARNTAMSRLWYKPDTTFRTPKAHIYLHFSCPESNYSAEANLLTDIFAKLLKDQLNEYAYYASIAGLGYSISRTADGFEVVVAGYNQKLPVLVEKIMEKITNFDVREDRFDVIKEKVRKVYVNMQFQQALAQAQYNLVQLIQHQNRHRTEYLQVLPTLRAETLSSFLTRLLSRVHTESYMAGQITRNEAEAVMDLVEDALLNGPRLKTEPVLPSQQKERRAVRLESGCDWYYCSAGLNEKDMNSAVLVYLQVGTDEPRNNVLLDVFNLTAKQPFSNQLRMVEQLGYIVNQQKILTRGVKGVRMIIQSTVKDPKWLDSRIESFLNAFGDVLQKMTVEEFKEKVDTLIKMKMEKHKNLGEECGFYSQEIFSGTLVFNRVEIEVAALKDIEKQDLLQFYEQKIASQGPDRRKLSVQIYSSRHALELQAAERHSKDNEIVTRPTRNFHSTTLERSESDSLPDEGDASSQPNLKSTRIKDIQIFKLSQSLYGVPMGLTAFLTPQN